MQEGDWHDTLLLNVYKARTRMLMAHFTGLLTIHCHILFHEDWGMMALIDIADSDEDWWTNIEYWHSMDCWFDHNRPNVTYIITGNVTTDAYKMTIIDVLHSALFPLYQLIWHFNTTSPIEKIFIILIFILLCVICACYCRRGNSES